MAMKEEVRTRSRTVGRKERKLDRVPSQFSSWMLKPLEAVRVRLGLDDEGTSEDKVAYDEEGKEEARI